METKVEWNLLFIFLSAHWSSLKCTHKEDSEKKRAVEMWKRDHESEQWREVNWNPDLSLEHLPGTPKLGAEVSVSIAGCSKAVLESARGIPPLGTPCGAKWLPTSSTWFHGGTIGMFMSYQTNEYTNQGVRCRTCETYGSRIHVLGQISGQSSFISVVKVDRHKDDQDDQASESIRPEDSHCS